MGDGAGVGVCVCVGVATSVGVLGNVGRGVEEGREKSEPGSRWQAKMRIRRNRIPNKGLRFIAVTITHARGCVNASPRKEIETISFDKAAFAC